MRATEDCGIGDVRPKGMLDGCYPSQMTGVPCVQFTSRGLRKNRVLDGVGDLFLEDRFKMLVVYFNERYLLFQTGLRRLDMAEASPSLVLIESYGFPSEVIRRKFNTGRIVGAETGHMYSFEEVHL